MEIQASQSQDACDAALEIAVFQQRVAHLTSETVAQRELCEKAVDFAARLNKKHSTLGALQETFLLWRIRSIASSAQILERARLRAEWQRRVEWLSFRSGQSVLGVNFRVWAAVLRQKEQQGRKAEVAEVESQGASDFNSRIHLLRCLQAWRRVAVAMSSLKSLRWIEPSRVCSPEFASAVWQTSPRVYRAVLLQTEA